MKWRKSSPMPMASMTCSGMCGCRRHRERIITVHTEGDRARLIVGVHRDGLRKQLLL